MRRQGRYYDPRLDRFDVAVRSLARVATAGRRALVAESGMSGEEAETTRNAVASLIHPLKTEAGVFELLEACPFLLDHALLLLVRYQARTLEGFAQEGTNQ